MGESRRDIRLEVGADRLVVSQLDGFFVGWPNPPDPTTHLRLLRRSWAVVVAFDETERPAEATRVTPPPVIGFINAISDGVLSAYIPLVEVRPEFRGRGVGRALVERMFALLDDVYMVDLACDEALVPFYEKLGMRRGVAMLRRNYSAQSGRRLSNTKQNDDLV